VDLRYGMLADYAGPGAEGKSIVVGIFDTVYDRLGVRPIPLPPCYLVAVFEAHTTEGTEHQLELRVQDEDGHDIVPAVAMPIRFSPQGPARPLVARVFAFLPQFPVPEHGVYTCELLIGGDACGSPPHQISRFGHRGQLHRAVAVGLVRGSGSSGRS
jgi:uncharacterized protein DUF6941